MEEKCPWSLSGPQFPLPTAIQQRYCYPKGTPEYSSRKGGALWTMCGNNNAEHVEFRLLHVYFSAKRAVNKGIDSDEIQREQAKRYRDDSSFSPSVGSKSPGSMSAKKKRKTTTLAHERAVRSPWQERKFPRQHAAGNGASKKSNRNPVMAIDMPAKLPRHSPLVPKKKVARQQPGESTWRSVPDEASGIFPKSTHEYGDYFGGNTFFPVGSFDTRDASRKSADGSVRSGALGAASSGALSQPQTTSTSRGVFRRGGEASDACRHHAGGATHDSFLDAREDSFDLLRGIDNLMEYMQDPEALWSKPSEEFVQPSSPPGRHHQSHNPAEQREIDARSPTSFARGLEEVHQRIRDAILDHPPSERGELLSLVANWASCLARSPLEPLPKPHEDDEVARDHDNIKKEPSEASMAEEETDFVHTTAV